MARAGKLGMRNEELGMRNGGRGAQIYIAPLYPRLNQRFPNSSFYRCRFLRTPTHTPYTSAIAQPIGMESQMPVTPKRGRAERA